MPSSGYAYWGFDFFADETGTPSLVRPDEFINRSPVPVTITLSFTIPPRPGCNKDCLPGVEFEVDAGWFKIDPPFVFDGDTASVTQTFAPGRGYGWAIGLWQATHARLTVSVAEASAATLQQVGMAALPGTATEIAAVIGSCICADGSSAACSDGSRFSNGLLGSYYPKKEVYRRAGAFNACPSER